MVVLELTYVWTITKEIHDISDGFIHTLHWRCAGTNEAGLSSNIFESTQLDRPLSLVDYSTFNKQATLVEALKKQLGEKEVSRLESILKGRLTSLSETPTVASSLPPD